MMRLVTITAVASLVVLTLAFPGREALGITPRAFVYPVMAPRMSSYFGVRKHPVLKIVKHHSGIDLAVPDKTPIRAIADGVVIYADPLGAYGNLVVIRHHGGQMSSHYGHCERIKVHTGQRIKAGQIIGLVGHTGRVTGPHLHLEIRIDGKAQNPERFIHGLALAAEG